jgi:hypothetical protein
LLLSTEAAATAISWLGAGLNDQNRKFSVSKAFQPTLELVGRDQERVAVVRDRGVEPELGDHSIASGVRGSIVQSELP